MTHQSYLFASKFELFVSLLCVLTAFLFYFCDKISRAKEWRDVYSLALKQASGVIMLSHHDSSSYIFACNIVSVSKTKEKKGPYLNTIDLFIFVFKELVEFCVLTYQRRYWKCTAIRVVRYHPEGLICPKEFFFSI